MLCLVSLLWSCAAPLGPADVDADHDTEPEPATLTDGDTDLPETPPVDPSGLPADRMVPWQGNVGVEGGIPARPEVRNCVTEDGVPTDGVRDAAPAIRDCLARTPAGHAAYLPAGTYAIRSREQGEDGIRIPSDVTLRGDGPDTILSAEMSLEHVVYIGQGYSADRLVPVIAGGAKGSRQLTLQDTTGIEAGDYLLVNQLNDRTVPVTPVSGWGDGDCSWCDQFSATRLRAQVVEVTGKVGDELELGAAGLFHDLSDALEPTAMRLENMGEYAGLEDLTVVNGEGASSGWRVNVMIEGAANSWVKNVRVENCGERCIDLRTYFYRVEVRDSTITGCIDHVNSDTCYGTEIAEGSNALIENNIYDDTSNGPIAMWGASGNVIAYNYIHDVFRFADRDSWFWPNAWTHGAHTGFNLWEGNDFAGLNFDSYWGSSSHNTVFRNRIDGENAAQGLVPGHVEVAAIIVETNNPATTIVGNVLGSQGFSNEYQEVDTVYWDTNAIYAIGVNGDNGVFDSMFRHHNYDYVRKQVIDCDDAGEPGCQTGDPNVAIPPSLYLGAAPAWFEGATWPPFDPEGPVVSDLPAKIRFEATR